MAEIPLHTVRYGIRDGLEVASAEVTRTYDGAVEDVWDALTSAERLPRWFAPVHGELREGGRFQVEGNAAGEVLECHPPRGFVTTWEMGETTSWLSVEVAELATNRTVVRIAHTVPIDNDHWRTFGPAAVGLGWDLAAAGLAMHLAGGAPGADIAAEGLAWMTGPDGVAYLRRCGAAWEEADLRADADPVEASERAAASVAAFTTPPS